MKNFLILTCCVLTFGWANVFCVTGAHAVTFDWAHIGNAGNAADDTGFGAVAYNYTISKTEVTNAQYVEFLNAVDPTGANSLALYNSSMSGNFGGIENTGATDGARYIAQADREQNPVTYVSWYDSVRFINWLHNGQGLSGTPSGDTEGGTYTLLGGTPTPSNGLSITRNTDAAYWLPSEDEWYKAAYHDASAGTAGIYFDYATGSDLVPVSDQPGDNPAAVNFFNYDSIANGFNDGFAVSGSMSSSSNTNPLTDVGAYTAAQSPYGTYDQNGNVLEWNEAFVSSFTRNVRGGSWGSNAGFMAASNRDQGIPTTENSIAGFRVATVPEPTSMCLLVGLAGSLLLKKRR